MTRLSVAFNAIPLLSPLTGIGHYARSLATALTAGGEVNLGYFYGLGWSRALRQSPVANIGAAKQTVKRIVPMAYDINRQLQQQFFNAGARRQAFDLYHEPNFLAFRFKGPSVTTVHDLSWLRYPETHPADRVRALTKRFPESLARSAHVITDAEAVRQEVIDRFGMAPERITAVALAPREIFRPADESAGAAAIGQFDLAWRRYFLCVGTLEPRKNLELALAAYAALPATVRGRFPLVVVGMKGWLTSRLDRLIAPLVASGEVRPIGYVDDETLALVYASARLLIYPSIYEGFGLPPLEAMASGTPVISSNVSSLPEVVGDAGIQVDPRNVDGLRDAILRLVEDEAHWQALRSAGLARAARFSWARCAGETLAVYRKVLA